MTRVLTLNLQHGLLGDTGAVAGPEELDDALAAVGADGLVEKEILIEVARERAAAAGVNIWQLAEALSPDNFTLASGQVRAADRKLLLRSQATYPALAAIEARHGKLDFAIHSMAFAKRDDLHGRVVDTSADGFALAMDVSTHSFVRLAKKAEPLLEKAGGGALVTMTYLGSEKVIPNYGVMGLCKAALEAATRYMAAELGAKGIRVNAVSPGPLMTRAASGIAGFDGLMAAAVERSPMHALVTPEDIGALTAFLVSDAGRLVSGGVHFVDAGYNIMA